MRNLTYALSALALLAAPAMAREPDTPEKPVTQKDVTAQDVVQTPATDLNLMNDEIPALLIAAEERPYTLKGLGSCREVAAEVARLDAVLGEDVDLPQTEGRRTSPGRVAQSVVGSLIPFRGLIREISGANKHDRELREAILAGVARRGFLKGTGQARGCRYPARSATLEVFNQRMAELSGERLPPRQAVADTPRESRAETASVRYVSRPVVQGAD